MSEKSIEERMAVVETVVSAQGEQLSRIEGKLDRVIDGGNSRPTWVVSLAFTILVGLTTALLVSQANGTKQRQSKQIEDAPSR